MNDKTNISWKVICLLFLLFAVFSQSSAQITSSANFIKAGKDDAVKIISAYLLPVERALCFNGANNNMFLLKSSKTSDFRFGLGFNLTTSFINADDYTYDVNKLNLEEFEVQDPNNTIAQTFAGNENTIILETKDKYRIPSSIYPFYEQKPILSLNSPKGKDKTNIPFPVLNLFVEKQGSLIDIKILPPLKIPAYSLKVFNIGVNVQHNLETSLKFISEFSFDLYISGAYNYNKITYYLDVKPNENSLTFSPTGDNGPYDNQEFQIHSRSIPLRLIIVKQISNFSFLFGGGYNITNSKDMMLGKYPVYSSDPSNNFQIIVDDIEDPFQYTNQFNKFSFDAGVNYHVNHFFSSLKYTYSYYKNVDLTCGYVF